MKISSLTKLKKKKYSNEDKQQNNNNPKAYNLKPINKITRKLTILFKN